MGGVSLVSGGFLGPGQRDVQQCEDGPLDGGELVEDGAGGGVGEVQPVEGGEGGAGGGDGGAAFGQDAGQGDSGAECGAQLGFDQPEDEQRDADDGDEGLDPVVVVQEHGPDPQGLLEVAVALLDDPLVFVDFQDVQGGQRAAVVVAGKVGGQRVQPVEPACGGGRLPGRGPRHPGFAGPLACGDGGHGLLPSREGLRRFWVDLAAGCVSAG